MTEEWIRPATASSGLLLNFNYSDENDRLISNSEWKARPDFERNLPANPTLDDVFARRQNLLNSTLIKEGDRKTVEDLATELEFLQIVGQSGRKTDFTILYKSLEGQIEGRSKTLHDQTYGLAMQDLMYQGQFFRTNKLIDVDKVLSLPPTSKEDLAFHRASIDVALTCYGKGDFERRDIDEYIRNACETYGLGSKLADGSDVMAGLRQLAEMAQQSTKPAEEYKLARLTDEDFVDISTDLRDGASLLHLCALYNVLHPDDISRLDEVRVDDLEHHTNEIVKEQFGTPRPDDRVIPGSDRHVKSLVAEIVLSAPEIDRERDQSVDLALDVMKTCSRRELCSVATHRSELEILTKDLQAAKDIQSEKARQIEEDRESNRKPPSALEKEEFARVEYHHRILTEALDHMKKCLPDEPDRDKKFRLASQRSRDGQEQDAVSAGKAKFQAMILEEGMSSECREDWVHHLRAGLDRQVGLAQLDHDTQFDSEAQNIRFKANYALANDYITPEFHATATHDLDVLANSYANLSARDDDLTPLERARAGKAVAREVPESKAGSSGLRHVSRAAAAPRPRSTIIDLTSGASDESDSGHESTAAGRGQPSLKRRAPDLEEQLHEGSRPSKTRRLRSVEAGERGSASLPSTHGDRGNRSPRGR